jgi:type VI secretion system protein ImpC
MDYEVSFGRIGKIDRAPPGAAFRLAVLGDFSGRANRGVLETGAKLAARKPLKVDVDNLDALIARLEVSIAIPVGEDGASLIAPIRSMDDFHPDQLVENLAVFEELLQLRRDLQHRAGFDRAAKTVLGWSGEEALPVPPRRARGSSVATDRRISDFARLTGRKPAAAEADAGDLIRRLVGPFIVPDRDARQGALVARVDLALSDAMRRVLHHPDFQAAEALWRGVEFLVRRIATDARMQIVLYDVSAEELAADVAAGDDLEKCGLYSLLVEQPRMDADQGALSMVAALCQFEATPPHADLLGRVAQVAAAAGAPFVAGIGPDGLKAPMHEWHPLTKQAWEALRALPASAYLALATPRFLLRMPYGKRTDPIDAFAFEEFTREGGLSGMLWGHPALLAANLVAETWKRQGKAMKLGSIASVGDLPVYVYQDADGEQIALPCTERLFSERQAAQVASTAVNPVVSLRGRPEVRMGGFLSVAGGTMAGQWAPVKIKPTPPPAAPAPPPAPAAPPKVAEPVPAAKAPEPAKPAPPPQAAAPAPQPPKPVEPPKPATSPKPSAAPPPAPALAPAPAEDAAPAAAADDLDALLASLNPEPAPAAEGETEPDLDALLASLK